MFLLHWKKLQHNMIPAHYQFSISLYWRMKECSIALTRLISCSFNWEWENSDEMSIIFSLGYPFTALYIAPWEMLICDGTLAWWKNITFAGVSDLSKASVSNLYEQRALSQNISATIYGGRLKRAKPFCDCEPPFRCCLWALLCTAHNSPIYDECQSFVS